MTEKPSRQEPSVNPKGDRLWVHIGNRMRLRRDQVGMTVWRAACGVGVDLQTFAEYEAGERLIPADQLAALAHLFNVPVFYFFEDLPAAETAGRTGNEDREDASYTVTTHTERIATLVDDFQKLDFARQQFLLAVARGLVDDNSETEK
jgi:transcriptional regulator with XRE-family HTH domain